MFRKNVFFSQIVISTGAKRNGKITDFYFCIACWSEISRLHSTSLHFARNDGKSIKVTFFRHFFFFLYHFKIFYVKFVGYLTF